MRPDEGGQAHSSASTDGGFDFAVLYCNFRSLAFLGLLGFLIRQLKALFFTTLLSAAMRRRVQASAVRGFGFIGFSV